jgi:hypothetical protein
MRFLSGLLFSVLMISTWYEGVASGAAITYITPTALPNSNANWPFLNGSYTQNFGIAFLTGSSGPFNIDWVDLGLNTSTSTQASASLTVALRSTTNTTAYSAVAGATEHAKDTVNFTKPTTTSTSFTLNLTSAMLPNISAFSLQATTSYALILYAPDVNIGMGRTTGYASGTTNNFYTVTNGFTMLTTFRNNNNYFNNANSYPSLAISFGATAADPSPVPEPSTLGIGALFVGGGLLRRFRSRFLRG